MKSIAKRIVKTTVDSLGIYLKITRKKKDIGLYKELFGMPLSGICFLLNFSWEPDKVLRRSCGTELILIATTPKLPYIWKQ